MIQYYQKLARLAGALFLLQLIPYYIGHESILGSILYQEDLLQSILEHRSQVAFAILLELLSAFSFIGFSVILYHFLKTTNLFLARIYLGIRFVEFAIIVLSEIKLITIVSIAQQYSNAPEVYTHSLEILGKTGLFEWQWITLVYMIVFCINALIFYYLLFKSQLVMRFISI